MRIWNEIKSFIKWLYQSKPFEVKLLNAGLYILMALIIPSIIEITLSIYGYPEFLPQWMQIFALTISTILILSGIILGYKKYFDSYQKEILEIEKKKIYLIESEVVLRI